MDCGYKLDVLVEHSVIVELKAIEGLLPIHSSQLLTYLKTQNKRVGLLINFNVPILKNGLKRIVNRYAGPLPGAKTSASSAFSDLRFLPKEQSAGNNEDPITQESSASSSAPPRLRVECTAVTDAVPSASSAFSDLRFLPKEQSAGNNEDPITQESSASSSAPPRLRVECTAVTDAVPSASSAFSDLRFLPKEQSTGNNEDPITQESSASSSAPPRLRVECTAVTDAVPSASSAFSDLIDFSQKSNPPVTTKTL